MTSMTGFSGVPNNVTRANMGIQSSGSAATGSSGGGPAGGRVVGRVAGHKQYQMPQFTPEQMQLFQQMFSHVGPDSYLSKLAGGDEEAFNQMEAPAMRQFQGMQGQLASRFSGMGMGGRRSSGFQNTMSQASSDFAQDLASKRHSMQTDAIRQLMGMSNELLGQRPNENVLVKQPMPFYQQLLLAGTDAAAAYLKGGGTK